MNSSVDQLPAAHNAPPEKSDSSDLAQSAVGIAALLDQFGEQLYCLPGVDGGSVNLVNEAGDALIIAHIKLPADFAGIQKGYQGFQYHFNQPDINVEVFHRGKMAIVRKDNLAAHAEITRMRFERWKMRSLVVQPLTVAQVDGAPLTIGTVSVFSQHCQLDQQLAEQINVIAQPFSAQIQLLWAQHQALERDKIVQAMSTNIVQFCACVIEMNSLISVAGVYAQISKEFLRKFGFDIINILMAEEGELALVHTAFSDSCRAMSARYLQGAEGVTYSFNPTDGQCGYVYTHDQHFLVNDVAQILHLPMSEKDKYFINLLETPRTLLVVPMRLNKKVIGTMSLVSLGKPLHLSETDITLIELLTAFSSTAIRNAKTHELMEQKNTEIKLLNQSLQSQMTLLDQVARKDHLTGINNFGNFEEELKRRTSEYERAGKDSALSIILLDVDHFKQFNDAHGHLAGNQVLQEVAARIMNCAREMDFVARYGGEEFVMLLPQCDLDSAIVIGNRIRTKISDAPFILDDTSYNVTISGGCAQFLPPEDPHDLIYRVDTALYKAKRNGRNRIEIAAENLD